MVLSAENKKSGEKTIVLSFSVVTPTLNQAAYISKTIQSVTDQNYLAFEHVIIDGGSTDGTIAILKKYPHLKWRSEKDRGRADALNKGFALAQGDVIAWINSDDHYLPETFARVARFFEQNPQAMAVVGRAKVIDGNGKFLFHQDHYPSDQLHFEGVLRFWKNRSIPQPSLFFKRETLDSIGYFDSSIHDYPDYDLVLRMSRKFRIYSVPDFYACICIQADAGSVRDITEGVLERKLYAVSRPHWKFLSEFEYFKIVCAYGVAYPFILWRARYESFAFKYKSELKRSWNELPRDTFFKRYISLILSYPAESICAAIRFLIKQIRLGFFRK